MLAAQNDRSDNERDEIDERDEESLEEWWRKFRIKKAARAVEKDNGIFGGLGELFKAGNKNKLSEEKKNLLKR